MEHGFKYITVYGQKHIAPLAMFNNPPLVRDKPLGAPAFVKLVYYSEHACITHNNNSPMPQPEW